MSRIGDLIDKLCTVNIKLYMTQDEVHDCSRRFSPLPATTTRRLVDLNQERTRLMREIEEALDEAIQAGKVEVDSRTKLT